MVHGLSTLKGIVILQFHQELHRIHTVGVIPQFRFLAFAETDQLIVNIKFCRAYNTLNVFCFPVYCLLCRCDISIVVVK
jgi:hypothetical protein